MNTNLLDKMLTDYRTRQTSVTIILQNKVRITGRIGTFDSYVIVMENQNHEIIYRHAISSLQPFVAAEQPRHPEQKAAQPVKKPAAKPAARPPRTSSSSREKPSRPENKTAESHAESGLNTGMKDGLLRWMQEQKAGK
jgi:RNA chaperone Hfq